jgi:hypothetical protein
MRPRTKRWRKKEWKQREKDIHYRERETDTETKKN